jgi:hypothetical protein
MTDTSGINGTISGNIFTNNSGKITAAILASVLTAMTAWVATQYTPHVTNVAGLQAFTSVYTTRVIRDGYLTAGDGGDEEYTYSAAVCPLNGGNGDNGSQVKAADGNCWLSDVRKPQRLRVYGAKGDNSTDDTVAVQAAISAVCAASGGVTPWQASGKIEAEVGVFVITNRLSIPCNGVTFLGSGNGNTASGNLDYRNTVFRVAGTFPANTTLFAYTSTAADYGSGLEIGNFSIDASGEPSTSWLFDISWLQHARVHDISILNPSNVLKEAGGAINLVENVSTLGQTGVGVDFSGDASGCGGNLAGCNKRADLLRLVNVSFNGTGTTHGSGMICINQHDFSQTLTVSHMVCENPYIGVNAFCNSNQANNGQACPAFDRFDDVQTENCWYRCYNLSDIQDWEINNPYVLGFGVGGDIPFAVYNSNFKTCADNATVGTYTQAIRIHGGRFGNAAGVIANISVCDFVIQGAQWFNGNLADTTHVVGAPAVLVTTLGNNNVYRGTISDNVFCSASGQTPVISGGAGPTWMSAVKLDPTSGGFQVDYVDVHDNPMMQCQATPAVVVSSTATHNLVHDNAGFNSSGGQVGPTTVGASPASICNGAIASTIYFYQSATNTATVKLNSSSGPLIGTISSTTQPVVADLGANECVSVAWATTAPTFYASIH